MLEGYLARGEQLARVQAKQAALRFVNGIDWLLRDPTTVVGRTPHEVVFEHEKLQVWRYELGHLRPEHHVPVLLVPPLMVKPFIFDLMPGRSLAAYLLERGFAVYMVDFGEPDRRDAHVTLDNYVLDWLPTAVREVERDSGVDEISLIGYCMGGIFALMHTAANDDRSVRNIVCIGTPIDSAKMGLLTWLTAHTGDQMAFLARQLGNIPGGLSSAAFKMLAPMKNVTRYADLFMNMWNQEYVNGFDAMNQWVGQFIDYPQKAFLQFHRDFMRHNRIVKGQMKFGPKTADLKNVRASIFAIAGTTDQVAPVAASKGILDAVGSEDATFEVAPGGHMGVFAGSTAPELVWKPAAEWLAPRSGKPKQSGSEKRRRRASRESKAAPDAPRRKPKTGARAPR